MREQSSFNAFGVNYRTKHFAAYYAAQIFEKLDEIHPTELLALTEVKDGDSWVSLAAPSAIDRFVRDVCGVLRPHEALASIMGLVKQYNFGFKVPQLYVSRRFRSKGEEPDDPDGENPILARLYMEGKASWRELQEWYSLEDAYRMHREWLKAKLKEAREIEAARKEAERKG
ncbi:hypothetical protein AWB78_05337 [Caballeronia calidae]|uniref:Uncharacterized protein n=1 Tax=Caballeronia calidae TaxID=1777139 RepID=A0A158DLB6_9BURK|nr:hypothetical protein [Caballeronia calidae]SAK95409.1 hypothetical protein AWB78_05337 [Caballeronia calidae]